MARMFNVYGVKDGTESFFASVSSAVMGKAVFVDLEKQGYEYGRLRDCLGGLRFEFNLKTKRKTA